MINMKRAVRRGENKIAKWQDDKMEICFVVETMLLRRASPFDSDAVLAQGRSDRIY
jgi:hypothetical protein